MIPFEILNHNIFSEEASYAFSMPLSLNLQDASIPLEDLSFLCSSVLFASMLQIMHKFRNGKSVIGYKIYKIINKMSK